MIINSDKHINQIFRYTSMNEVSFSNKPGKAYYWNNIPDFIKDKSNNIIGQLVRYAFENEKEQTNAWENQITELQKRLDSCGIDGDIIFEYDIVRLGKRIDVILLIRHMVFSLEFKNGKEIFTAQDAQQAEDYAIDIKNFHKESENLYVCPILIATDAKEYSKPQPIDCYPDKQIFLQRENIETMIPKVDKISKQYGDDTKIDFDKWFNSAYCPTPTIIAAAVEAYRSHNISEIAHSEAGQDDIDSCESEIDKIIQYAQNNNKKCICFVTGVPGAGKTLVGLDMVSKNLSKGLKDLSVYISGNGPLVEVLREALIKSIKSEKKFNKETHAAVNTLIQDSFGFKRDNVNRQEPTAEKILIFDEAQRVWNKEKMARKHKNPDMEISEPHLMFKIMDRHKDWTVIICLVGLGQDIYDGEVGINEWFRCGIQDYPEWELFYSPRIFNQTEKDIVDRELIENCTRCHKIDKLHLSVSIRTFRSEKQSSFINSLLSNNPEEAKTTLDLFSDKYPIYVTRNIERAKKWAKQQVRGSQRCGLLASSGAQRLKPYGVYVPTDIDVKNWFLASPDDLRSSNMMEIAASEFKVQGLEIDWGVICWDADLRRIGSDWDYYSFRGNKWVKRKQPEQKRYLLNSYRVLLTRSRQGMVIFVPIGTDEDEDKTRCKEYYDGIFNYLQSCGIKTLSENLVK